MKNEFEKLLDAVAATLSIYLLLGQSIGYNELAKLHGLKEVSNKNWKSTNRFARSDATTTTMRIFKAFRIDHVSV